MANVTLRLVKGSPLTNSEVDNNFSNLNIFKVELGRDLSGNVFLPLVSGLWGRAIGNIAPSNGQALIWISANSAWEPGNVSTSGGPSGPTDWNDVTNKPDPIINVTLTGSVTGTAGATLENVTGNTITITTSLAASGVTAGTYGNGNAFVSITTAANGLILAASNVIIPFISNVIPGAGISVSYGGGGSGRPNSVANVALTTTGVTSGVYGNGNVFVTMTVGADGRITSASNVIVPFVANVVAGTGILVSYAGGGSGNPNVVTTVGLTTSGVTAGAYGNSGSIASFVVDNTGRITSASNVTLVSSVGILTDNAGFVLPTGNRADITVPFNCTVQEWVILASEAGNISYDIYKSPALYYPPVAANTITGSAPPRILGTTANLRANSTTLTGWTTSLVAGENLRFVITAANVITRATLQLRVNRT